MMVMMMAMTPSLKASILAVLIVGSRPLTAALPQG
jgi:hypothetical protein